jgi:hypothetical protein
MREVHAKSEQHRESGRVVKDAAARHRMRSFVSDRLIHPDIGSPRAIHLRDARLDFLRWRQCFLAAYNPDVAGTGRRCGAIVRGVTVACAGGWIHGSCLWRCGRVRIRERVARYNFPIVVGARV